MRGLETLNAETDPGSGEITGAMACVSLKFTPDA